MLLDRRQLLSGLGMLALTACAPDPAIHGDQALAPSPVEPTQGPGIRELSQTLVDLVVAVTEQQDPYRAAAQTQVATWQERLLSAGPVIGGTAVFTAPSPTTGADLDVDAATQAAADAAHTALEGAVGQPLRLLLVSILLGARGLSNTSSAPSEAGTAPRVYPDATVEQALGVALTHTWALLQALEKGLGVLPSSDPVWSATSVRVTGVKQLRNQLIKAVGTQRPEQDIHYDLPAITDAATLQAARLTLELRLLDALAAVAAAGQPAWLPEAVAQVTQVQDLGGQLPTWPGWHEA